MICTFRGGRPQIQFSHAHKTYVSVLRHCEDSLYTDNLHLLKWSLFASGCIQRAASAVLVTFGQESWSTNTQMMPWGKNTDQIRSKMGKLFEEIKVWQEFAEDFTDSTKWLWEKSRADKARSRERTKRDGSFQLQDDVTLMCTKIQRWCHDFSWSCWWSWWILGSRGFGRVRGQRSITRQADRLGVKSLLVWSS